MTSMVWGPGERAVSVRVAVQFIGPLLGIPPARCSPRHLCTVVEPPLGKIPGPLTVMPAEV